MTTILVTGAGGFIGGHLVKFLAEKRNADIIAVDIKPFKEWDRLHNFANNQQLDLQEKENCVLICKGIDEVYNLAAEMGGIGFIENHKCTCMLNVLINTHMLWAAEGRAKRFFYSSSACVYNANKQLDVDVIPLKEEDAYPAMPEDGYGWEKLFSERMCRHFREDLGLQTRVARFHNVYGPLGTWYGGKEKAPAAICRKVIEAKINNTGVIDIWGDGTKTRSFMYIDDCLTGIDLITQSDVTEPLNLGSNELVSINGLVSIIEDIAGVKLKRNYILDAPQGVNGRNSDNTKIKKYFNWEPSIRLKDGLEKTYRWIYDEYVRKTWIDARSSKG